MAVSKTQNERPAIVDLIDLANELEGDSDTNARNIEALGEAQATLAKDVFGILAMLDNIKFGLTVEITVPANGTYSGTCVFDAPFDENAECFVFLGFADGISPTTLSLTLLNSSYSDFSYSVSNTDTDPATVTVGYLALAVLPLS